MSGELGDARLQIRLFGGFQVTLGGQPLPALRSRAEQRLLAWLSLRGHSGLERDAVAGILWPESTPDRARFYLRRGLSDLRKALGNEAWRIVTPAGRTLQFDPRNAFVDVQAFDAAVSRVEEEWLKRAAALYHGPLLPGWFEDWVITERLIREQAYLRGLEHLAELAAGRQAYQEAVEWLRRAVAIDPSRETAQRSLLEALAAAHDFAGLAQAYRTFRLYLHDELNAAPAPETVALYRRLQSTAREMAVNRDRTPPCPLPPLPTGRLPIALSPLIGREAELDEVYACLQSNRLVTLTGAGGVGKTRLSIALAERAERDFPDGVWFVDLAPLTADSEVFDAIASALDIREVAGRSMTELLLERLGPKTLLLILDNCEHLLETASRAAESLCTGCPGLKTLTTSRQPLGVSGEVTWRVPSLAVPEAPASLRSTGGPSDRARAILASPAVRLFADRARRAMPGWSPRPPDLEALATICRQLDGIPLAIELAAARVKALPVEEILARLGDRFHLLTGGSRTRSRQQTLRATMDWSWGLLETADARLLARLSVFSGGWTLDAAEAVCADTRGSNVLDGLTSLADKSLICVEHESRPRRYALMETVRQYAGERLAESGEAPCVRSQHTEWFLAYAERADALLAGPEQKRALEALSADHENLNRALTYLHEAGETEQGLLLAGILARYWYSRGHFSEGRSLLSRALDRTDPSLRTYGRAKALSGAGVLASFQADFQAATALQQEALDVWRALDDRAGMALSLNNLGSLALHQDEYATARGYYEESLALRREMGDRLGAALPLGNLAQVAYFQGDFAAATTLNDESLSIRREAGDERGTGESLILLAELAYAQGDQALARSIFNECLGANRSLGDKHRAATCLLNLGHLLYQDGDCENATRREEESLELFQELGDRRRMAAAMRHLGEIALRQEELSAAGAWFAESLRVQSQYGVRREIAHCMDAIASLMNASGSSRDALLLWAAASALRGSIGLRQPPAEAAENAVRFATVRGEVGEEPYAAAWSEGFAMKTEAAIEFALRACSLEVSGPAAAPVDDPDTIRRLAAIPLHKSQGPSLPTSP